MPAYKKCNGRSVARARRASSEEADYDKRPLSDDYDMVTDNELEKQHDNFRAMIGLPPASEDGGQHGAPHKQKRILSSKAKAALESQLASDGSVEPEPKRKSISHGKKSATSGRNRVRPAEAHPASLVRLKSPVHLSLSKSSPAKIERKYKSYKDAVSGESASSDEDETMSSREEHGSASGEAPESLSNEESGSLVDFIDDRAEEELSVDSADSVEDPKIRKARLSKKKRSAARRKTANSASTSAQHTKGSSRSGRHDDIKNTSSPEAIIISDDSDDDHRPTQVRPASSRNSKGTGNTKAPVFVYDGDGAQPKASTSKKATFRRRQASRDREYIRAKEGRSKGLSRVAKGKRPATKVSGARRKEEKRHSSDDDRSPGPVKRAPRETSSKVHDDAADEAVNDEPDSEIEWPSTPDRPTRKHSKKESPVDDRKSEPAAPPIELKLVQGQDILLAETYESMEPLKPVDLIPLFGSQDPPEDEGLKLSDLLKLYESTPASNYLGKRLKDILLFEQQGVLVNPSRAKLNKVTTSNYGTSTYFAIPASVVQPRHGALPFYACFIITGACAYCYLRRPAEKVFGSRSVVDHRIGLYPIEFEYQHGLTYHANVARKSTLRYSFTSGILAFTSKTEGSSESNTSNFGASPKKSKFHRDRVVPAAQSSSANPALEHFRTSRFPAALSYTDNVPIFDARGANFLTGPFDLSQLHTLPLYAGDIDESSIVTIGYTSNTYVNTTGNLAGVDVLSMNVQFVVLHAGPPA